jgi:nifR3 family TIM-barrel protein
MAGITNPPFRLVAKECGSALTTSEEIAAVALCMRSTRTLEMSRVLPGERPLAMQLLGRDPAVLAEAARILEGMGADIVDLNMGCPVQKVVKKGEGAALMQDPEHAALIFRAMRNAIRVPLTIKIRCGWDDHHENAVEIARVAEAEGVDAITIHPRSRAQQFHGKAKWDVIGEVVDHVSIPVTGNGDVLSMSDARGMMAETGCHAVMIGRGALGRPWVFDNTFEQLPSDVQYAYKTRIIHRHADLILSFFHGKYALIQLKKHVTWYTVGLGNSNALRRAIYGSPDCQAVWELFTEFWDKAAENGVAEPVCT